MTNYERLLDLPFREVLKEIGIPDKEELAKCFYRYMNCAVLFAPCSICGDVEGGGCLHVCEAWLDAEASPDANYNEDYWHNAEDGNPPTSDPNYEYAVFIHGASLATTLGFDGENFIDYDGNVYNVDWWRPLGERPQVTENE